MRYCTFGGALTAVVAFAIGCMPMSKVIADEVADFYEGKTVTLQVGFEPGGGYDLAARAYAKYLGKYIPGNPNVIVENVPGAGTLKLTNQLYEIAPRDGTVIGLITTSALLLPLYGRDDIRFDSSEFNMIASLDSDTVACGVWKGAGQGIKTIQDLVAAKETVVFGSSRPTSNLSTFPMFFKNALGANIKVVNGYGGSKDIVLAMQSGELHGSCVFYGASLHGPYSDLLGSGDLNIFAHLQESTDDPVFSNTPSIYSVLETDEQRQMARFLFGPSKVTRPVVAPPGVPAERVAALRKAAFDVRNDPDFIAAAKASNINYTPLTGEEMQSMLATFYEMPRELIDKTQELTVEAE